MARQREPTRFESPRRWSRAVDSAQLSRILTNWGDRAMHIGQHAVIYTHVVGHEKA